MWQEGRFLPTLSIAISAGKFGYASCEMNRSFAGCSPAEILCVYRVRSFWSSLLLNDRRLFFCATIYVVPDFLHYFLRFDQSSTALCRYRTNTKMIFTLSKDTIRRITGIRVNYSARKLNPRDYLETDSNWNIIVATISLKFIGIVVFFYPCNYCLFRCSTRNGSRICLFDPPILYNVCIIPCL